MNATERPSRRKHERQVLLIIAIVATLVLGVVGYELNWIRQRRAARHESRTDFYFNSAGELEGLPARGVGPLDELVMRLLGERKQDLYLVIYPELVPDSFPTADFEELAVVRRAHWLFPEAIIIVEYLAMPVFSSGASEPIP